MLGGAAAAALLTQIVDEAKNQSVNEILSVQALSLKEKAIEDSLKGANGDVEAKTKNLEKTRNELGVAIKVLNEKLSSEVKAASERNAERLESIDDAAMIAELKKLDKSVNANIKEIEKILDAKEETGVKETNDVVELEKIVKSAKPVDFETMSQEEVDEWLEKEFERIDLETNKAILKLNRNLFRRKICATIVQLAILGTIVATAHYITVFEYLEKVVKVKPTYIGLVKYDIHRIKQAMYSLAESFPVLGPILKRAFPYSKAVVLAVHPYSGSNNDWVKVLRANIGVLHGLIYTEELKAKTGEVVFQINTYKYLVKLLEEITRNYIYWGRQQSSELPSHFIHIVAL
jgi:hypothetical protein